MNDGREGVAIAVRLCRARTKGCAGEAENPSGRAAAADRSPFLTKRSWNGRIERDWKWSNKNMAVKVGRHMRAVGDQKISNPPRAILTRVGGSGVQ